MMGDVKRAGQAFTSAQSAFDIAQPTDARRDYGSSLRDGAALLTLAAETRTSNIATPKLMDVIATAYQARTVTSTQEQAWLLLAAHALTDQVKSANIAIDGAPVNGTLHRTVKAHALAKDVVIANNGDERVDAVVSVIGASLEPQPEASKGFTVTRSYYTLPVKKWTLPAQQVARQALRKMIALWSWSPLRVMKRKATFCWQIVCRQVWKLKTQGSWIVVICKA